jgi:hypothetical protein
MIKKMKETLIIGKVLVEMEKKATQMINQIVKMMMIIIMMMMMGQMEESLCPSQI